MSNTLAWSTIEVSGSDAAVFLDGQLTQSITVAAAGAWTAVLEPDSIVITAAWLRQRGEVFELLVPAQLADRTVARLNRFRLRVDVRIEAHDGAIDPPLTVRGDLLERAWPWNAEFAYDLAPHAFGDTFVAATVSFTKGCFTGQELVGRMDARGASMPFRFALVRAASLERAAEVIQAAGPDRPKGITTVFDGAGEFVAHAIVHRSLLTDGSAPDDVRVEAIV